MYTKTPVMDRIKQSYAKLSSVATALNTSSDRLSISINDLEAQLKTLGLGVSSSVIFDSREPKNSQFYDNDSLSYCKLNGKWVLAIATASGDYNQSPDDGSFERWPFNEAPRGKRVRAVKAIPDLLDALAKDAAAMVADVDEQISAVTEITEAISMPVNPPVDYLSMSNGSLLGTSLLEAFKPENLEAGHSYLTEGKPSPTSQPYRARPKK